MPLKSVVYRLLIYKENSTNCYFSIYLLGWETLVYNFKTINMKKFSLFLMMLLVSMSFVACSSDDDDNDSVSLSDHALYVGDSVRIGSDATVANRFVASVAKDGYLHGFHVGETTASYKGQTAKVAVRGHYNSINVQTDWTLTPEQLKVKQGGTPDRDVTTNGVRMVVYKNVGVANLLAYSFDNNKLVSAMAFSNPSDMDELLNFLKERYLFLPEEVDSYTYFGVDALDKEYSKTAAMLKLDSSVGMDYMLQTMFMSTEYLSKHSSSNAKSKVKKAVRSELGVEY